MGSGRFEFEKCVTGRCRCAAVHPALPSATGRLLALVIATYADGDGNIPAQFSPSLTALAAASGRSRSAVAVVLSELERSGWIVRDRPPIDLARSQKITTTYRLASPARGLVQEPDQSASPATGPTSPVTGSALVRPHDTASPVTGHNQYFQNKPAAAGARETARADAQLHQTENSMRTDPHAEQLARVAGILDVNDPGPIIDNWTRHRPGIRNPLAVIARMPPDEIHKELGKYKPKPGSTPPCPDCGDSGWLEDPVTRLPGRKCTHPNKAVA